MEELIEKLKAEIVQDVLEQIPKRDEKRVYNGVQASEYLNISPCSLCKIVRKGFIKQTFLQGFSTPCYLKEDLDRYIEHSKEGFYK